jgi:cytochrome c-type biogenesis protein
VVRRHYSLIVAAGGIILIVMGVLIWTGELYRINIEVQRWMSDVGPDFWSSI